MAVDLDQHDGQRRFRALASKHLLHEPVAQMPPVIQAGQLVVLDLPLQFDLADMSLQTVKMFHDDARAAGFHL